MASTCLAAFRLSCARRTNQIREARHFPALSLGELVPVLTAKSRRRYREAREPGQIPERSERPIGCCAPLASSKVLAAYL